MLKGNLDAFRSKILTSLKSNTLMGEWCMQLIKPSLFTVMRRFPERKHIVQRLFHRNQTFRTLCDDYGRCTDALSYWNQSTTIEAAGYRKEYTELVGELESEIRKFIEMAVRENGHTDI